MANPTIRLASERELPELIAFLARPDIDQSFELPLSQRAISIAERVKSKFTKGFWVIALSGNDIVGCRGCGGPADNGSQIVEFSTMVVDPMVRGKGIGKQLIQFAIAEAARRYKPLTIHVDIAATSSTAAQVLEAVGFERGREYDDPEKRPPGVRTVEYTLRL